MRRSQWSVFSAAFFLLFLLFIYIDIQAEAACGTEGIPPDRYNYTEWFDIGSLHVSRVGLWCINTEIFDPFVWLFAVLCVVCVTNGFLEKKSRR